MEYHSKYTGAEVDALLGQVESGDVGGKVTVDSALSTESENPVMNKVITAELSSLGESVVSLESEVVRIGDYSPTNKVGTADDLAGRGESVPASFGFRASGGKSIKDGRAYIKRIKGNSVVWNQRVKGFASWNLQGGTIEGNEVVWSAGNRTGALNAYSNTFAQHTNHKYLISADVKASSTNVGLGIYFMNFPLVRHTGRGNYESLAIITIGKGDGTDACYLTDTSTSGYGEIRAKNYRCIDLTQMFQAGNEPTTIEEFNARVATLGIDMNAYNEGQVIHCNTESIKSVGDNAVSWDYDFVTDNSGKPSDAKNYEEGKIYVGCSNSGYVNPSLIKTYEHYGNGIKVVSSNGYGVGVFVKVLPNAQYYAGFNMNGNGGVCVTWYDAEKRLISHKYIANGASVTSTENTKYALISLIPYYDGVNEIVVTDFLFSLVHSGWKQDTDAGYQPYWQDTLPLPIIRKYFPNGMKKAGSAHDEIRFNKTSGKWEAVQRIGSVDMGSMAWSYDSANQVFTSYTIMDLMTHPAEVSERNKGLLCSKYSPSSTYIASTMDDKSWLRIPKSVTIKDTSYTDAATFKAAMQGVILYYELAEPIVTELDAEDQNFRDYYNVADFGTEEAIPATDAEGNIIPSANFSADIIYQFNAVDMIREHELEITELQKVIATMQAQLASLTSNNA